MSEDTQKGILPKTGVPIPDLDQFLDKKILSKEMVVRELARKARIEIEEAAITGEYTIEQLKRWRTAGQSCPEFVSRADWNHTEEALKPLEGIIVHLGAMAMEPVHIAATVGKSTVYVNQVLNSRVGQFEIRRIQDEIWGMDFKKLIHKLVPLAIQTAVQAMLDPKTKASTRVEAAFKFMDRAMGKPIQQVQLENNLLRSMYEKLDKMGNSEEPKDVAVNEMQTGEDVLLPEPEPPGQSVKTTIQTTKDDVDAWIEENL